MSAYGIWPIKAANNLDETKSLLEHGLENRVSKGPNNKAYCLTSHHSD